jgi:2-polyprenyl-3-methyl-5-hydroxy-6-metoxy-1,4-benzoquinol methylase
LNLEPEQFAKFYTDEKLGLDLQLVNQAFNQFKSVFVGTSCLELGPATGYMTKSLVKEFKQVTAVEGSKSLFNQIPDYDNLIKINCLFENFEPEHKYDTIILNHVLEHIADPIQLLKLIYGWLSDNGILIVGVPNAKSFHRLAAVKIGLIKSEYELNDRDIELGHYRVYDFELLLSHLKDASFKIQETGGVFLKFLANYQIENFLNKDIINAYMELGKEFKYNSAEIYAVVKK